jgi:hypothetical protein
LSENTLLNTCLQGTVEERIEHGVGGGDVVVGANVLLDLHTAVPKLVLKLRNKEKRVEICFKSLAIYRDMSIPRSIALQEKR